MNDRVAASPIPTSLAFGAVRIWHIVFFYVVIFVSTAVAGTMFSRSLDADYRAVWARLITHTLIAVAIVVLTAVVPEMRRSVPVLYGPQRSTLSMIDVALFLGVMSAWSMGASRLFIVFPALHFHPGLFSFLGYSEHYWAPSSISLLLWLLSSAIMAPFAEELFFRGYLQNLVHARWGLWPGIVFSSLIFGTAHVQWTPIAMVAGIFLSLVYLRFGSLWPGTLLHGLYNIVASIGIGRYFAVKDQSQVTLLSSWLPEIALTVAFFPLLYLFWRRFKPAR